MTELNTPKPRQTWGHPLQSTPLAERMEAHRQKLKKKAARRSQWHQECNTPKGLAQLRQMARGSIADQPHEHKREIARHIKQEGRKS